MNRRNFIKAALAGLACFGLTGFRPPNIWKRTFKTKSIDSILLMRTCPGIDPVYQDMLCTKFTCTQTIINYPNSGVERFWLIDLTYRRVPNARKTKYPGTTISMYKIGPGIPKEWQEIT